MTGIATIRRHVTQEAVIRLDEFHSVAEATRIALEASDAITRWNNIDPQVFVEVEVDAG